MLRRGYFSHTAPDGGTLAPRVRAAGYSGRDAFEAGEALGTGTEELGTPQSIVLAWLASPPHRRILLARRFRDVGVGVRLRAAPDRDPRGATYVLHTGLRRRGG